MKMLRALAALALGLGLSHTASAQTVLDGSVTAIALPTFQLAPIGKPAMEIAAAKATFVREDGTAMTAAGLTVGMQVRVEGLMDKVTLKFMASRVTVLMTPPPVPARTGSILTVGTSSFVLSDAAGKHSVIWSATTTGFFLADGLPAKPGAFIAPGRTVKVEGPEDIKGIRATRITLVK